MRSQWKRSDSYLLWCSFDINEKHSSLRVYILQAGCVCIPYLIPALAPDPYWFRAPLCLCIVQPWFIFTLFVYMDWTVCRGQKGGGSATVNKRWIVRKHAAICDLCFIPQLLELKRIGAFLVVRQQATSLIISTCQSRATHKDKIDVTIRLLITLTHPLCGLFYMCETCGRQEWKCS